MHDKTNTMHDKIKEMHDNDMEERRTIRPK